MQLVWCRPSVWEAPHSSLPQYGDANTMFVFFGHKLNWRILQTLGCHRTSSIEAYFIFFFFIYVEVFGQSQASAGWNSFPAWNWNLTGVSVNTGLSSNWVKLQVWLNYSFQSNPVSKLKKKQKCNDCK